MSENKQFGNPSQVQQAAYDEAYDGRWDNVGFWLTNWAICGYI